jgi:hypothetical protein
VAVADLVHVGAMRVEVEVEQPVLQAEDQAVLADRSLAQVPVVLVVVELVVPVVAATAAMVQDHQFQ